ncbi:cobyrinic acid a,c-diamide synthase [Ammoniphilus oxalaticus]|uniref:Cobyrinic acid a,c-diamide synthase n=1 Tax=Ammoniphilus oxalaticus TaxID=66863 RepID=A0A419SL21_9BACL|nr:cobyrinic acid a,c-diamide synthase [Ammoniphilus oxalaticus]
MSDQAQHLREFMKRRQNDQQRKPTRVLAVTSGKGGVGKSNFTINFGLSLVELGQKVVIIDLDLGMANINILLGLTPRYSMMDLIDRDLTIWEIMEQGPRGIEFISGGSGFHDVLRLDEQKLNTLLAEMEKLHGYADVILLDLGAGISGESLRFILAADEVILISTPEPTAITDAYSLLKIAHGHHAAVVTKLIVNRVQSYREGEQVAKKIEMVANQFLNYQLETLGYIEEDRHVLQAVKKQRPFCLEYPNSKVSKGLREMAKGFMSGHSPQLQAAGGMKAFIHRLTQFGRR